MEKACPWLNLKSDTEPGLGVGTLPPQPTLSTKNSFSENFNTSGVSEKCISCLNIESQQSCTLCSDGSYLQDTLGIAPSWAVARSRGQG